MNDHHYMIVPFPDLILDVTCFLTYKFETLILYLDFAGIFFLATILVMAMFKFQF